MKEVMGLVAMTTQTLLKKQRMKEGEPLSQVTSCVAIYSITEDVATYPTLTAHCNKLILSKGPLSSDYV
jgi:hypothetical protein